MIKSIRNFDDSREVRELLDQGMIGRPLTQLSTEAFFGYFSRKPEQELVLFRDDFSLKLRDCKNSVVLIVDDKTTAVHEDDGKFCNIKISREGIEIIRSNYLPKRRLTDQELYYDLTQRSDEDDDFGKFIRNVIEEPGRKYRVFRSN